MQEHPSVWMSTEGSVDFAALTPGGVHDFTRQLLPTPQTILDGSYSHAITAAPLTELVMYLPRRAEYLAPPGMSILFSVNGKPGPYIVDILKGRVYLDNGSECVFEEHGWRRTIMVLDWPGMYMRGEVILARDDKGSPITRNQLALEISSRIGSLLCKARKGNFLQQQELNRHTRPWALEHTSYRDIRLVSLNYYKHTWVPVLAVDYSRR